VTLAPKAVLAIDPGSSCGWAIGDENGIAASGVWQLKPRPGDSPGMRYIMLLGRLEDVLRAYPTLDLVVYEQAHQRGRAATEYALGVATHVQSFCARHRIEHAKVHSASVKKNATGIGNCGKEAMVTEAKLRFGRESLTDDEADALWILDYARKVMLGWRE
jgi:Holliday junction resolvasome RuvABC endonuclease subunit